MSDSQQLELGVLPPHARSALTEAITQAGAAAPEPTALPGAVSAMERAITALVPDPEAAFEQADASAMAYAPGVAPGGDVELPDALWSVQGYPRNGSTPAVRLVHAGPGRIEPATSAVAAALAAMDTDGVTSPVQVAPPVVPGGPVGAGGPVAEVDGVSPEAFSAAIRAGRAVASDEPPSAGVVVAAELALAEAVAPPVEPLQVVYDFGPPLSEPPLDAAPAQSSRPLPPPPPPGPLPAADRGLPRQPAGFDDFGPLLDADPPRRRRPRAGVAAAPPRAESRPRRRWWGAAAVAAGLALLLAVGAWVGARPGEPPAPPPAAGPGDAAPSAAHMSWRGWRGMDLPVSSEAGPAVWEGDRVAGFARSPLGAAIAAAHLSVRVDPAAGEAVWGPVLADQVVGARDRLAAALAASTTQNATPGEPGLLDGWRLDGDPADGAVTAHLAVRAGDGTLADYAIPLAWTGSDWALDIPRSGAFFAVGDTWGTYTPFEGNGGDL